MKFGKTPDAVGRYRLSKTAEEDLVGIALFGDEHFGIVQSNRYRDQLKRRFTALAEQPLQYPAVDHLREGYRRSVCGVHSIFFRIDGKVVEIVRILKNQDPKKQL
jgi:toxin ParE1/3/4